jgi:hypothetical protein
VLSACYLCLQPGALAFSLSRGDLTPARRKSNHSPVVLLRPIGVLQFLRMATFHDVLSRLQVVEHQRGQSAFTSSSDRMCNMRTRDFRNIRYIYVYMLVQQASRV